MMNMKKELLISRLKSINLLHKPHGTRRNSVILVNNEKLFLE